MTVLSPTTYSHNATIVDGVTDITASSIQDQTGQLDHAIGDRSVLPTPNDDLVTAVNRVNTTVGTNGTAQTALKTRVDAALDGFGGILANTVSGSQIVDGGIDASLKVIDQTLTGKKLDPTALAGNNIVWESVNRNLRKLVDFGGKSRWYQPANLSFIDPDASNPFGNATLRHSGGLGGKKIYADEKGIRTGDKLRFACIVKGAASSTWSLNCRAFDSNNTLLGSGPASSATTAGTGAAMLLTTATTYVVPANTSYIVVWLQRISGADTLDIYALWGNKGDYISSYPTNHEVTDAQVSGDNLLFDTYNTLVQGAPVDFGLNSRWFHPEWLTLINPDANNPFGAPTLRHTTAGAQVGKKIYLQDVGLQVGEYITAALLVNGASGGYKLRIGFWDASNSLMSSLLSSTYTMDGTNQLAMTTQAQIPANTDHIVITWERQSGTATCDIYAWWCAKGGWIGTSPMPSINRLHEPELNLIALQPFGFQRLQSTRAKLSKIIGGSSTDQLIIDALGDSWFQRQPYILQPLRSLLQLTYGNAGPGYVGIGGNYGATYQDGWSGWSRLGTWTDLDEDPNSKGIDINEATTTDTVTPGSVQFTATVDQFVIHYYKQPNGGTFTYQIDANTPVGVNTANATGLYATLAIPVTLGSHTIKIVLSVANVTGLKIFGIEANKSTAGVRLHKFGNGGSATDDWSGVDATNWQNGIATTNADLIMILLGANDRTVGMNPFTYANNIQTIINRARVALPLVDVLLIGAGDTSSGTQYSMGSYNAAMRRVATQNKNCAFMSIFEMTYPYADALTRGMQTDALHLTDDGGRMVAHEIFKNLRAY